MDKQLAALNQKFPGGLIKTSFKDTDYPNGNVHWLQFNGAHCPICGKTDWCCVNVTGTKVICMRVQKPGAKQVAGGYLYELHDGQKVAFDPSKVKPSTTIPYANSNIMDTLYRLVLLGCPLTEEHRANLKKRGLTDEQIQLHASRGFGSYYASYNGRKTHHVHGMPNAKFAPTTGNQGTLKSRWEEVLTKLDLPKDAWKGVPGFYLKQARFENDLHYKVKDAGQFVVKAGSYAYPAFESKAEGMLVPYYNQYNQLVGFQIRVDHTKVWAKVLEQPSKTTTFVEFKPGTNHYVVKVQLKHDLEATKVAEGDLKDDKAPVTIRYGIAKSKKIVFEPHVGGKYFWVSSARKTEGAEGSTPIQVSYQSKIAKLNPTDPELVSYIDQPKSVWLTEGGLKAIVATNNLTNSLTSEQLDKYGRDFLAVAGVSSYRKFIPMLEKLHVRHVTVAFDMDFMNKSQVSESMVKLVNLLQEKGYAVTIAFWRQGKGIDDALVNGAEIRFKDIN